MPVKTPKPVDLRKRLGLSQTRFAKLLDIPLRTLTDWEQGLKSPSGAARALLRILDRDPVAAVRALTEKPKGRRG